MILLNLLRIIFIFFIVLLLINKNKGMHLSILIGTILIIVLFKIGIEESIGEILRSISSKHTLRMIAVFYLTTYLQRIMDKRGAIVAALRELKTFVHSKRIQVTIMPFLIGLLSSVSALYIASDMVDNILEHEQLENADRCVITSYYRHFSESFFPTYPNIIMACEIMNVSLTSFIRYMIISVVLLWLSGYIIHVRKIARTQSIFCFLNNPLKGLCKMVMELLPIFIIIGSVLVFSNSVVLTLIIVNIVWSIKFKFTVQELKELLISAMEFRIISGMVMVIVFTDLLFSTGSLKDIPDLMIGINMNRVLSYGLIMMLTTILGGALMGVSLTLPLLQSESAFPLMIFLMGVNFIGSQFSPTHICLPLISERYGIRLSILFRKTIPIALVFLVLNTIYYLILKFFIY